MLPFVTHVGTGREQYYVLHLGPRPICRTAPEFFRSVPFVIARREEREMSEAEYYLPMVGVDEFLEFALPQDAGVTAAVERCATLLQRREDAEQETLYPHLPARIIEMAAAYAALVEWAGHAVRFALSLRR